MNLWSTEDTCACAGRLQFRVVIKWLPNSFHNTSSVCQQSYILPSSCNSQLSTTWTYQRICNLIGHRNSLSCNRNLGKVQYWKRRNKDDTRTIQGRYNVYRAGIYWYDGYHVFFFSLMTVNVGNSVLTSFLSLVNVQLSILDLGLPSLASHRFLHNNNNNNNIIKKMYQITTVSTPCNFSYACITMW